VLFNRIQNLTNLVASETQIARARPQKLERALAELRSRPSLLDSEIPKNIEEDHEALQEKITRLISELRKEGSNHPNKKSLDFVAYFLTAPNLEVGWVAKRAVFGLLDSALENRRYRSTLRTLLYGYIEFFDPNRSSTAAMARYISQRQEGLNRRWSKRVASCGLLDHQGLVIRMGSDALRVLPSNFFDGVMTLPRSFDSSGIKLLGLREACEQLSGLDQAAGQHDQFLDAYVEENSLPRNLAAYVLEPLINWFKRSELESSALKERVQSLILRSFGDPRMQGGMNSWPPLYLDEDGSRKKSCQDELTRWLTKDTLRLFFKAIKRTAETQGGDSAALRHWPQRQSFWERYLDQGYIDQAWVILGDRVSAQLHSLSSKDGLDYIKFGQFTLADNAAIIMRVGQSATVVEWSHNGAVWVCPNNHELAPKMFSTGTYRDRDLRAPREAIGITYAARGGGISRITHDVNHSWRAKLDSAIHDLTGIELRGRYLEGFRRRS
jgi:hypothetical protein